MKVLSIGNSFSQDAQRYLHRLAKADGFDLQTTNLYIGGCSLETHHKNMREDLAAYDLEINGNSATTKISIREALESAQWDVVTVQQVSSLSGKYETYFPYVTELVDYVRSLRPNAKIYVHETWPYENGSELLKSLDYATSADMFSDVKANYQKLASVIHADKIIHSGSAMLEAINRGMKIHRDTFHASYGAGRYMIALVWYKTLTGNDITNNTFADFDEDVSLEDRKTVIKIANMVCE